MLRLLHLSLFSCLAFGLAGPARAESFLNASADDAAAAYEAGPNTYSRQRLTDTNILVGRQGTNGAFHQAVVFPFQLPNFGAVAAPFTNAEFIFRMSKESVSGFNLDLYGLPSRTNSGVLPSSASTTNRGDFFMGGFLGGPTDDNTSGVVKLQDNIATASTGDGIVQTNIAGGTQLAAYLNAQYNNGAGAGRWVFLRLSTDAVPGGGAQRYNVSTTEQTTAENRPRIRYNFTQQLYTRIGTDLTFQQLVDNGTIVPGIESSPGPVPGSTIDVNNPLLQQQTGVTGPIAQDIRIHTQVNSSVSRSNFGNFTRWYQEDGNVQVMRLFQGEQNVRSGIGPEGTPGRIEAFFTPFAVASGTWAVWEATYTIIDPLQANIFQLFHEGGQLWAFHLRMTSSGNITFNRRSEIAGLPTNLTLATDMVGKSISFRVRANGRNYELYQKDPLAANWELVTTGRYTQAVDNKISFRWGMYHGSQAGQSIPEDGLLFVSGVNRSTEASSNDDPPPTPPPPVSYYWDNNGATAGFGTATGIWGETTTGSATQGWSTSSAGSVVPADVSTNSTDPIFFGTSTTGLASGTITVSDTVSAADITFGSASGNITLNGGEIQMFGSRKITSGGGFHTIRSALSGDGTRTIGGTGTIVLTGASSFEGPLVIGDDTNTLRLRINSIANADGTPSAAGAPTSSTNGIIQVGAVSRTSTLELNGATAPQSTNRRIRIGSDSNGAGGATIQNNNSNAANTLTFTNSAFNVAANVTTSNRVLTLGGSNTGDNTIQGAIIDNVGTSGGRVDLIKADAGTWVLAGPSSYSGSTSIQRGIFKLAGSNDRLPTSTTVSLGDGTNTAQLDLNGRSQQIARLSIATDATAANNSVTNSSATPATLTVAPTSSNTFSGLLTGNLGLTKSGSATLTLSGTNTYTGPTTIAQGTLAFSTTNPALGGGLTIGASAGATETGGLNLTNASLTVGGAFLVRTNSTTANTLAIGSGRTLQINGPVTIGYKTTALPHSVTRLDAAGAGTLAIGTSGAPTNANVQIGGAETSNVGNAGMLDLGGLTNFSAYLGTGIFRVGTVLNSGGQNGGGSTVVLAGNSLLNAAEVTLAAPDSSAIQTLRLGGGTNEIYTNTLNVGGPASGDGRSNGQLIFNGSTGTLRIRSQVDPANGRATLNVGNITMNTGVSTLIHLFDTSGRSADLRFSTMTIGARSSSGTSAAGNISAEFKFDTGTLDTDNLVVGSRTGSGSGLAATGTGVVSLGGGTVTINNTSGPVSLGSNSFSNGTGSGTLNISGGNVTIAAHGGNSILLGNATVAGGTAAGALNLTGGTLTVAGHIVRGATTGTSTATLTVNGPGAILDMGGKNITGLTAISFANGTIRNPGVINTGLTLAGAGARVFDQASGTGQIQGTISGEAGLAKHGSGTLVLTTTNTYTAPTIINGGILRIDHAAALNGTSGITVNGTTGNALAMGSGITTGAGKSLTINGSGPSSAYGALTSAGGTSEWQGNVTIGSAGTRIGINSTSASTFTISGIIDSGGVAHGLILRTRGSNSAIVLSGANTYLGETRIFGEGGTVRLSGGANRLPVGTTLSLGSSGVSGILDLNGQNQEIAGLAIGQTSGTFANEVRSATATTLTVNTAVPSSYSGSLTGAISLVKTGPDTLTLTGTNTHTGSTTVNQGTLALVGASVASPISVASVASLGFTLGSPATSTSSVNLGNGGVKISGTVDGSSDYVLLTATGGITGTPVLLTIIPDYQLQLRNGGTSLVLAHEGDSEVTYPTWANLNAGSQGPGLDFDLDGVPNGIEFFLNAAPGFTAMPTLDANRTITWTNGGNLPASAYGTSFLVQTSDDLVGWDDVPAAELNANTDGPGGTLSYTLTGNAPRFVRLKVMPE